MLLDNALLLLLEPAGIVALVRHALAAVEFQGPLGDLVEEVAVVGDEDDAAREVFQVVLQPGDRLGVEVVGRFVEQQHVRFAEQQAGQGDAALFTARQLGHARVVRRATQRVHGHFDAAVDVPQVTGVDLFLERVHFVHQLVGVLFPHELGDLVEPVERLLFLAPRDDVFPDILAFVEMRLLLQVAHLGAVGGLGLTGEFLVHAGHDLQQGRLTRAVDADDADLGVGIEREPDVLENLLAAGIDLGQALHLENILLRHIRTASFAVGEIECGDVAEGRLNRKVKDRKATAATDYIFLMPAVNAITA